MTAPTPPALPDRSRRRDEGARPGEHPARRCRLTFRRAAGRASPATPPRGRRRDRAIPRARHRASGGQALTSWLPASATSSSATTASVPRSSGGSCPTPGRGPGRRLRHPRHAPRLRPARPQGPLVIVDAVPGPGDPGRSGCSRSARRTSAPVDFDPHGMDPVAVLASLEMLGGTLPPTYVVGCVPATVDDGIGLSAVESAAVDDAVDAVSQAGRQARDRGLRCASGSPVGSSRCSTATRACSPWSTCSAPSARSTSACSRTWPSSRESGCSSTWGSPWSGSTRPAPRRPCPGWR